MSFDNLLSGPAPTLLPTDPAAARLAEGAAAVDVVRDHPTSSLTWALLSEAALNSGDDVAGYAYARVGYHRGLDALRAHGWKGHGPIPWAHQPNQGFLRCLADLAAAAESIGEGAEATRCRQLLSDSDPDAPLDGGSSGGQSPEISSRST